MDLSDEGRWVEVDDFFGENGTIVINGVEFKTVLERLDVELFEKGSL